MMAPIGLGLSCFGIVIWLVIGSAVFRWAVAIVNGTIGPIKIDDFGQWDDWDSYDEPIYRRKRRRGDDKAIAEPSLGLGMLHSFVAGLVVFFVYLACHVVLGELMDVRRRDAEIAALYFCLPLSFVILTAVTQAILSTTFWRAAAIVILYCTIGAAIVGIIAGTIFVVLFQARF